MEQVSPLHAGLLEKLESGKAELLALHKGLRGHPDNVPLFRKEWSYNQHVDHIVLSERILVGRLRDASSPYVAPSGVAGLKPRVVSFILRNGIKVPVPVPEVVPGPSREFAELEKDWDETRVQLKKAVENLSSAPGSLLVFTHPTAGPKDVAGTLQFMADHLTYHRVRVKRLINAAYHHAKAYGI